MGLIQHELWSWKAGSPASGQGDHGPLPSGRQGHWPAEARETSNREGMARVSSFIVDRPSRASLSYCARSQHQRQECEHSDEVSLKVLVWVDGRCPSNRPEGRKRRISACRSICAANPFWEGTLRAAGSAEAHGRGRLGTLADGQELLGLSRTFAFRDAVRCACRHPRNNKQSGER